MKTRIISGIVMGAIVTAVIAAGLLLNTMIITIAIGLIAAVAGYELIHNAVGIKSKVAVAGVCIYLALSVLTTRLTYHYFFFISIFPFLAPIVLVAI